MSRPSLLAAGLTLVLASTVLAGCLGPQEAANGADDVLDYAALLSQPIYSEVEKLQIKVPGHDGKPQDTWVFKPKTDDPDARFPVFINFSPYWGNLAPAAETGGDAFSLHMIDYFVPRGYAIVLASLRGTGDSGGCFPIGGVAEMRDAYEVIDHYAGLEWSTGAVGSGGKSYDGTTIQGVAGLMPHPALKLVFPVSGISDLYRYNYRGGVPYLSGAIFNAYYVANVGMDVDVFGRNLAPRAEDPMLVADDVACADFPDVQANGLLGAATGLYTPYWIERDYNRYAANVDTAFFYVHGFQDWNVKPDHILPFISLLPAGTIVKAYLHQWTEDGTGHVYPMREDWNLTMHRVMDQYLLGIDMGVTDEPAFHVQDSTGMWRTEETWPPAHATATKLVLQRDGLLGEDTTTGIVAAAATADGPLTWTYEVNETLHYAGMPVLYASLGTTDPETAWVAQLLIENETGIHWMNEGVLRARLRESFTMPSPVVPGQMYDHAIEFYPQDDVFPAGSKLILTLDTDGARFPVTPAKPNAFSVAAGTSYLELPLVDPEGLAWEAPQPVPIRCFTC